MAEQQEDYTVTLKSGDKIDARLGSALLAELQFLLERKPEHFSLLSDLARGKEAACGQEVLGEMILNDRGELRESVIAVFRSAYREAADGSPRLDDPFQPATESEREAVQRVAATSLRRSKMLWKDAVKTRQSREGRPKG